MKRRWLLSACACALIAGPALAQNMPPTPSQKAPLVTTLSSATCTVAFVPVAGRVFNVSAWGTWSATLQLYRSFDGGVTQLPLTVSAGGTTTTMYTWTAPFSDQAVETEYGVSYYLCANSYTSGTVNVRVSQ